MVKLSGAIGYSLLKKNNKYILILSDIHSKQPYCKNGVMIDDYLKFSNDQNNTILLEEVSREGIELKALWSEAEHTNRLKDLFLKRQDTPKLFMYPMKNILKYISILALKSIFDKDGLSLAYKFLVNPKTKSELEKEVGQEYVNSMTALIRDELS